MTVAAPRPVPDALWGYEDMHCHRPPAEPADLRVYVAMLDAENLEMARELMQTRTENHRLMALVAELTEPRGERA